MADEKISHRLQSVRVKIREYEKKYARTPNSVRLLAVSKTMSERAIVAAFQAGQTCFGENYLQEAQRKIVALDAYPDIEWHFIGSIQSNKAGRIAQLFSWVHTVERLSVAEKLSEKRLDSLPPLNVCIQVNVENESGKSGISVDSLAEIVASIAELPRLKLRGLMAIPVPQPNFERQRNVFRQLRQLYEALLPKYDLDTLSMGMSADFEAAIAEGATIVRVGTGIFGARAQKHKD